MSFCASSIAWFAAERLASVPLLGKLQAQTIEQGDPEILLFGRTCAGDLGGEVLRGHRLGVRPASNIRVPGTTTNIERIPYLRFSNDPSVNAMVA
jgi:hypothetical protein